MVKLGTVGSTASREWRSPGYPLCRLPGADRVRAGGRVAEIRRRHADAQLPARPNGADVSHTIKRDLLVCPASAVLVPLMVGWIARQRRSEYRLWQ